MTAPPTYSDADFQARVARNPALLCTHHALMMSLFPMAVITLFQQDHLGLTMAEIMLVQAAFGAGLALFEFPSGYLADRIGYRKSMIGASVLSIFAWGLYCFAIGFWSVLAAELAMGFALSLVSGTNSAMLYESLSNVDRESEFTTWFGRARFFGQFSEGSAALVAGLLFGLSVRLPFQMMVLVWIINLGVALLMVEPRFARHEVEKPLEHIQKLVGFVANAPRLRALFAVSVVLGLSSFVPVWLVTLYARDAGVPVTWLGPIWAAANYFVALGSIMSDRIGQAIGLLAVCLVCAGLLSIGYFGMGLAHAWWGFAFYFAFNLSRGLSGPLLAHAEQEEIPSGDRASLVSLRSLLFRASFIIIGPLVGTLIDVHGQHPVLLGLGLVLGISALASCALLARNPSEPRSPTAESSI